MLSAEQDILDIAEQDGPFDGILGYSQGATLAAQAILRHEQQHPHALPSEKPFRFGIFFNGGTPGNVFPVGGDLAECSLETLSAEEAQLYSTFRDIARDMPVHLATLPNGRVVVTNGKYGLTKWDFMWDGSVMNLPTLHVRCPTDYREYGEGLYKLCNPDLAKQFIHSHGHDFPRGYDEMRKIAKLVRTVAEMAS